MEFMRNAEFMVIKPHPVAMIQTPSGVYVVLHVGKPQDITHMHIHLIVRNFGQPHKPQDDVIQLIKIPLDD